MSSQYGRTINTDANRVVTLLSSSISVFVFRWTVVSIFLFAFLLWGLLVQAAEIELLQNTNFEGGLSFWSVYPVADGVSTSADILSCPTFPNAHAGCWYAYVGDKTTASKHARGVLRQDVTIPPYATALTLHFYLGITSDDATGIAHDTMGAYLTTYPGDTPITTFKEWSNKDRDLNGNPKNYIIRNFPVNFSGYADQTVIFKFYGQTDDSLYTTFRIDDVSLKATVPDPNLVPYAPGWAHPIVVSKQSPGTADDPNITSADTVYISWAGINVGAGPTFQIFYSTIYLDNVPVSIWSTNPRIYPNGYFYVQGFSIGSLTAGTHTIRLQLDSGNAIIETGESDNEYSRTFSVTSPLSIAVDTPGTLSACNSASITWTTSGDTTAISYFKLGYSLDGGNTFVDLGDRISSFSRSYPWTPHALRSPQARVRISAYNSADQILQGAVNPNNFAISIPSGRPTAVPATLNISPAFGSSVQFYGSGSMRSSACSEIVGYLWDFGDGTILTAPNPTHSFFPSNGSKTYTVTLTVTDANGEVDSKSLSTYVSGQSLGAASNNSFSRDPVNLATGNYIYEHVDLHIPGIGFPFEFKRFYNSKFSAQVGLPVGFGWTHSYNLHLSTTLTDATVVFGDGHSEIHILNGGQYTGEAGVYDILTNNGDGTFTLTSKDQSQRNFDIQGRLSSIVDKNGNTLMLRYDESPSPGLVVLTNIVDTAGRQINFESDSKGLLRQIADPLGRIIQFLYDANTNLVAVTNANGGTNGFAYDGNHQMTTASDARGTSFVQNTYDSLQRVVSYQSDAYGSQTGFYYDFISRITYVTNALLGVSVHYHDTNLLVTNLVDEAGNRESYQYDASRNRIRVRNKNGNETQFSYDGRGNVTNKIDALGNITSIGYDTLNDLVRKVDALGNVALWGYDSRGNLKSSTNELSRVTSVEIDARGLPIIVTDGRGIRTTNQFDAEGNLTKVLNAMGFSTRFEYDSVGRRIREIDALNHTNSLFYDNNDNLLFRTNALGFVTTYTYDANNNRTSITDARGATTSNIFDLKDRPVGTLAPLGYTNSAAYDPLDRKTTSFDALGNQTGFSYNPVGNLIAITNALSEVTQFTFDGEGNQTSVTDPTGHYLTNFFDPLNRRITTISLGIFTNLTSFDALGHVKAITNGNGQVTRFLYDAIGRLTNVLDAANNSVFFAYDENGNRIRTTDPNNHSWTNVFDELNRLVEQNDPSGHKTILHYDAVGNLTNKITPNGDSIHYAYDALNRLTNITYPNGPPVTFAYDPVGNRTNMTDKIGTTAWEYDPLNRLKAVTGPFGQTVLNTYDAQGNRVSLTYPDNGVVNYGFDSLNRMAALTNWFDGFVHYTYDSRGNLSCVTNLNGSVAIYSYDDASRLTGLTNYSSDGSIISGYALVLDPVGNRLQGGIQQPLTPIISNQTNVYSYDEENRLTDINGQAVTHNSNGDVTGLGPQILSYDFDDRLIAFSLTNVSGTCEYDGLGNRIARSIGTDSRRFVLDRVGSLTQVLTENDEADTPVAYYIYGLGLVQRITPGGEVAIYHFDPQGSTLAITDSVGNITDAYAYDSFGVLANSDEEIGQPFRYLGQYGIIDDSTGLYYARARYFSPQLSRFITQDPLSGWKGDGQRLNRFVYALNNPFRFEDLTGESAHEGHFQADPYAADAAYWGVYYKEASWMVPYLTALKYAGDISQVALAISTAGETAALEEAAEGGLKAVETPATADRIRGVAQQAYKYAVENPRVDGLNRMQLGKDAEVQATRWLRRWAEQANVDFGPEGLQFQVRGANSVPDVIFEPARQILDFKLTPRAVRPAQTQNFLKDFPGYNIEYIFGE